MTQRQIDAILRLDDFLAGDPAATEDMRAAIWTWFDRDLHSRLETALGLPSTPGRLRLLLRNHYLSLAADELTNLTEDWQRASVLADEIKHFRRKWPAWKHLADAPGYATVVERYLHRATRYGSVPGSPQRLFELLRK